MKNITAINLTPDDERELEALAERHAAEMVQVLGGANFDPDYFDSPEEMTGAMDALLNKYVELLKMQLAS
jgi:hypothetical protein